MLRVRPCIANPAGFTNLLGAPTVKGALRCSNPARETMRYGRVKAGPTGGRVLAKIKVREIADGWKKLAVAHDTGGCALRQNFSRGAELPLVFEHNEFGNAIPLVEGEIRSDVPEPMAANVQIGAAGKTAELELDHDNPPALVRNQERDRPLCTRPIGPRILLAASSISLERTGVPHLCATATVHSSDFITYSALFNALIFRVKNFFANAGN